jgi:hypothetical protein
MTPVISFGLVEAEQTRVYNLRLLWLFRVSVVLCSVGGGHVGFGIGFGPLELNGGATVWDRQILR